MLLPTDIPVLQGFMYSMPALLLLAAGTAVVPVVAAFEKGQPPTAMWSDQLRDCKLR